MIVVDRYFSVGDVVRLSGSFQSELTSGSGGLCKGQIAVFDPSGNVAMGSARSQRNLTSTHKNVSLPVTGMHIATVEGTHRIVVSGGCANNGSVYKHYQLGNYLIVDHFEK